MKVNHTSASELRVHALGLSKAIIPVALFHALILQPYLLPPSWRISQVIWFYPLVGLLFLALHFGLAKLSELDRDRIGGGWVAGSSVIGFLSISLLLPDLVSKSARALPLSIQFFLPFTAVFVSDAVLTVRWISRISKL